MAKETDSHFESGKDLIKSHPEKAPATQEEILEQTKDPNYVPTQNELGIISGLAELEMQKALQIPEEEALQQAVQMYNLSITYSVKRGNPDLTKQLYEEAREKLREGIKEIGDSDDATIKQNKRNLEEALNSLKNPSDSGKHLFSFISIGGFILSFASLSLNFTGNAVSSLPQNSQNFAGILFLFIALIGTYFWHKK